MSILPTQNNFGKLNIVVLYDHMSTHVRTTWEYLSAFRKYSRHNIYYLPATAYAWSEAKTDEPIIDFSLFDVVIVHYSIRFIYPDHLDARLAAQLTAYDGLKLLFIQDEHEKTETVRRWMDRLQFDIVYTCVPDAYREQIYPQRRFPKTSFRQVITGYLPDDPEIETYALPLKQRKIWIGYRGRVLSPQYGALAREKYIIGVDIKKLAKQQRIPIDIEVINEKRIYGSDWYRFLGAARATLGSESGSNVFDFDGSIEQTVNEISKNDSGIAYEEIYHRIVAPHEGPVRMNQISPRIFEAIRLRTALILFEGDYSGVVRPDIHYIPLKKDYSNIDDVFKKLQDIDYLEELTDRTYRDVVESGAYTYRHFIGGIDSDIEVRIATPPRYEMFSTIVMARSRNGSLRMPVLQNDCMHYLSTTILGNGLNAREMARTIESYDVPIFYKLLRIVYDQTVKHLIRGVYHRARRHGIAYHIFRPIYRRLPRRIQNNLVRQSIE